MADVAFDSNKHAQTRQDVEHGGAAIASSSEAIARLTDGQNERLWTDEAGLKRFGTPSSPSSVPAAILPLASATLSAPLDAMSIKRSRISPPSSRRRETS